MSEWTVPAGSYNPDDLLQRVVTTETAGGCCGGSCDKTASFVERSTTGVPIQTYPAFPLTPAAPVFPAVPITPTWPSFPEAPPTLPQPAVDAVEKTKQIDSLLASIVEKAQLILTLLEAVKQAADRVSAAKVAAAPPAKVAAPARVTPQEPYASDVQLVWSKALTSEEQTGIRLS